MGKVEVCVKEVGALVGARSRCYIKKLNIVVIWHMPRNQWKNNGRYYILPTHSKDSIKVWVYQIRPTVCKIQPSVTHNKLATLVRIKKCL